MGKVVTYDLYRDETLVLKDVVRKDIATYIGHELPPDLSRYIKNGYRVYGRYLITYAGYHAESQFEKEWNDAVKPFKNVIWVKTGGRKLRVGGKK